MFDKQFDKLMMQVKKTTIKNNVACGNSCVNCSCRKRVKFSDFCTAKKRSLYTLHKTCGKFVPIPA